MTPAFLVAKTIVFEGDYNEQYSQLRPFAVAVNTSQYPSNADKKGFLTAHFVNCFNT